ncbi:hypothetical protein, partial [Treponema endosymbiont of Eucomonympha sp.]|uniref:hypothetical protein n=1 Tax=Treponema endosymbiont of Eucomonympha sp. TaxID=1580831 RepID=UPI001E3282A8
MTGSSDFDILMRETAAEGHSVRVAFGKTKSGLKLMSRFDSQCFHGGSMNKRVRRVLSASGLSMALFSCATLPSAYKGVDAAVKTGAFDAAVGEIAAKQTPPKGKNKPETTLYPEKNRVLLYLDRGMLEHYAGDYEASYADLSEAEREIEEAYTKSVTQSLASYAANDNAKDYAGEDYEDIYVNIFNALNAYHADNGQAYALVNDLVAQGGELQVLAEKY